MRSPALLVAALSVLAAPRPAGACASCDCGDPTLTTMGLEKPFAGRLRVSTEVRAQRAETGVADVNRVIRTSVELDLGVSWTPLAWLEATAQLPVIAREATTANDARERGTGLGDLELRARAFAWRDRGFSPTQLLAVSAGLKLPTAPRLEAGGAPLSDDAQPGTGSWDPLLGVAYSRFGATRTFYASLTASWPTGGWDDQRAGAALLGSVAVQLQPSPRWAVVLDVDSRLEAATRQHGRALPDSGGFVGYLSPRVVVSPVTDLLLSLRLSIPVVQATRGDQHEGPILALSATLDL